MEASGMAELATELDLELGRRSGGLWRGSGVTEAAWFTA